MDYYEIPHDVLAKRLGLCVGDRNRLCEALARCGEQRDELLAACKEALEELGEPAEWKDVSPATHRRMIATVAKVDDAEPEEAE